MYQRGEDIIIGAAVEGTRGTYAAPQIYIKGRTPAGISVALEKVPIKETTGSKIATQGSEIVQKRAEGDFEFNIRVESFVFFLLSLLGDIESEAVVGQAGAYDHTLSVLPNDPEHPSLSFHLVQPANKDYKYPLGMIPGVEMKITPSDLAMATANMMAASEVEGVGHLTPSFQDRDYYFRHQDFSLKIADDVAGLAAATAIKPKEHNLAIGNGGRPDQNVSELNPGNMIALALEPKGSMVLDLKDETYHDIFEAGSYKAMQVVLERADITIGSSTHPKITITLPKVSFETYAPDRPIDEVVQEKIEFMAHFDSDEAKAIEVVVRNERANYNPADES